MMDATKYAPGYYPAPAGYDSWVKKDHIEQAPAFCSVDLRDGNQALIVPSPPPARPSMSSCGC